MSYGSHPYGGVGYAAADVAEIPQADTRTALSVEAAFTTGALETPAWEDITADVRFWDVQRGRSRELERFQPGRATIVLSNLSRQYDAVYADGPHFGDLRPMRRVRIRETFNGVTYPVFDGFVDRWELDYPAAGHDATATLTATDAFKIFARTDLGRSVYANEVAADAPVIWWHLDEVQSDPSTDALNAGSLGDAGTGTYVGPPAGRGEQAIVHFDPGSSIRTDNVSSPTTIDQGVELANANFDISDTGSWAIEFWATVDDPTGPWRFVQGDSAANGARMTVQVANTQTWQFRVVSTTGPTEYGVAATVGAVKPNERYHIVAKFGPDKAMAIYVNNVRHTTTAAGTSAPPLVGNIETDMSLGLMSTFGDLVFPKGSVDEFAVYTAAAADDPLPDARIEAHYEAGTSPWQDDQPDDRLSRILDLAEWPSDLRELDPGSVALQSAEITDTTVLEHAQKVAETEFGLLFVNRAGEVRFVSRSSQFGRLPGPTIYGDGAGEVGYRSIRPDDGDEVIRNSVTISRLNGVAKTDIGATTDEFGRFQYTLDGLLHRLDSYSADYADFIVSEYEEPRRRITELTIGPPPDGDEDLYYPAMLGPELGDAISVTHTPQGLGDPFEQTCVVEGILHSSAPGRNRTTTFILSPELEAHVGAWQDWTPTLTNLTLGNGTLTARYARDGQTIHFRFILDLGSTSAVGTNPQFSLPVASHAAYSTDNPANATVGFLDSGTANWIGQAFLATSTCHLFSLNGSSNLATITATAPFTWTTGDVIAVEGAYEAAF